jgi:hypothetical protein
MCTSFFSSGVFAEPFVLGCSTAAVFFERLGDLDQIWTTRNRCESMWFLCCWFECRCCGELEKGKRGVVVAHTTGATMTVTDCRMYEAPFPEVDDVVMVSVCTSLSLSFLFSFRLLLSIIKPFAYGLRFMAILRAIVDSKVRHVSAILNIISLLLNPATMELLGRESIQIVLMERGREGFRACSI